MPVPEYEARHSRRSAAQRRGTCSTSMSSSIGASLPRASLASGGARRRPAGGLRARRRRRDAATGARRDQPAPPGRRPHRAARRVGARHVDLPHDHRMWAIIGIYEGPGGQRVLSARAPGAPTLTESGGKQLPPARCSCSATTRSTASPTRSITYRGDSRVRRRLRQPTAQPVGSGRDRTSYDFQANQRRRRQRPPGSGFCKPLDPTKPTVISARPAN